jgi:hypothetical protein
MASAVMSITLRPTRSLVFAHIIKKPGSVSTMLLALHAMNCTEVGCQVAGNNPATFVKSLQVFRDGCQRGTDDDCVKRGEEYGNSKTSFP